ncbi:MAG: phosphoribosylanthranilate isomerase [Pirellulales bacterium]
MAPTMPPGIEPRVSGEDLFRVKICGVTTPDDARLVAEAGADAIGFNFVPGSVRCLDLAAARGIASIVPPGVLRVGVFAGADPAEIRRIATEVGLDTIQLHGHLDGAAGPVDPPATAAALAGLRLIRAVRLEGDGLAAARRWLVTAAAAGARIDMVIVDASVPRTAAGGALGGTGARVDWAALAAEPPLGIPLAVAGGLDLANVAEAIRITRASSVDTASGVESAPGRKDPAKVRAFIAAARDAFAAV